MYLLRNKWPKYTDAVNEWAILVEGCYVWSAIPGVATQCHTPTLGVSSVQTSPTHQNTLCLYSKVSNQKAWVKCVSWWLQVTYSSLSFLIFQLRWKDSWANVCTSFEMSIRTKLLYYFQKSVSEVVPLFYGDRIFRWELEPDVKLNELEAFVEVCPHCEGRKFYRPQISSVFFLYTSNFRPFNREEWLVDTLGRIALL